MDGSGPTSLFRLFSLTWCARPPLCIAGCSVDGCPLPVPLLSWSHASHPWHALLLLTVLYFQMPEMSCAPSFIGPVPCQFAQCTLYCMPHRGSCSQLLFSSQLGCGLLIALRAAWVYRGDGSRPDVQGVRVCELCQLVDISILHNHRTFSSSLPSLPPLLTLSHPHHPHVQCSL